jgi:CheY-like chemotaxis protein
MSSLDASNAGPTSSLGTYPDLAKGSVAPLPLAASARLLSVPADRPLLGLTLLLVEDSRLASEGMRLLCQRSGARLRRADSLQAAERHLKAFRPSVVVVDLGLPDGSGLDLIRRLAQARPCIDAIIATSGDDSLEGDARAAGAGAFIAKPIASLAAFQAAILSGLPSDRTPRGPRALPEGVVNPDPVALRDDLCRAAEVLARGEAPGFDYVAQFLQGVAKGAGDEALILATGALSAARAGGSDGQGEAEELAASLLDRLALAPAI